MTRRIGLKDLNSAVENEKSHTRLKPGQQWRIICNERKFDNANQEFIKNIISLDNDLID